MPRPSVLSSSCCVVPRQLLRTESSRALGRGRDSVLVMPEAALAAKLSVMELTIPIHRV